MTIEITPQQLADSLEKSLDKADAPKILRKRAEYLSNEFNEGAPMKMSVHEAENLLNARLATHQRITEELIEQIGQTVFKDEPDWLLTQKAPSPKKTKRP